MLNKVVVLDNRHSEYFRLVRHLRLYDVIEMDCSDLGTYVVPSGHFAFLLPQKAHKKKFHVRCIVSKSLR